MMKDSPGAQTDVMWEVQGLGVKGVRILYLNLKIR